MSIHIYTDGSFRDKTIAWAFVAHQRNEIIHQDSGIVKNPDRRLIAIQSAGAEIFAVMNAICWALEQGFKKVLIHHDYDAIEAYRSPTAKNYYVRRYKAWIQAHNKHRMSIKFRWVKSHSGNRFNELADQLAKQALEEQS